MQLAAPALEMVHGSPASAAKTPASGASRDGGRGGPFTPQTTSVEVASTISARQTRLI
jgi:hypothetical protein